MIKAHGAFNHRKYGSSTKRKLSRNHLEDNIKPGMKHIRHPHCFLFITVHCIVAKHKAFSNCVFTSQMVKLRLFAAFTAWFERHIQHLWWLISISKCMLWINSAFWLALQWVAWGTFHWMDKDISVNKFKRQTLEHRKKISDEDVFYKRKKILNTVQIINI